MDYNRIISSAYSWISLSKVVWFLAFFWLSLPVLLLLPSFLEQYSGVFGNLVPLITILYDITYVAVILGLVTLTQQCLKERQIRTSSFSITRLLGIIVLVFVEAWHVLVWNLSSQFRIIQVLLLIATGLLFYYYTILQTPFVQLLFALCATAYFILAVYNFTRVFFSTSFFCNKDISLESAVKESWNVTHNKFYETMTSILLSLVLVFILFSFSVIVLGTITSLVLSLVLITPLALSIGFKAAALFALAPAIVAYHYAITEVYAQLNSHSEASTSIRKILAKKVLHFPARQAVKSKAPARKLAKKQPGKKRK
jgi:hypothetical protein